MKKRRRIFSAANMSEELLVTEMHPLYITVPQRRMAIFSVRIMSAASQVVLAAPKRQSGQTERMFPRQQMPAMSLERITSEESSERIQMRSH